MTFYMWKKPIVRLTSYGNTLTSGRGSGVSRVWQVEHMPSVSLEGGATERF
jgi:hypothetical protein